MTGWLAETAVKHRNGSFGRARQPNLIGSIVARNVRNASSVGESFRQNPGAMTRAKVESRGLAWRKDNGDNKLRDGGVLVKVPSKWRAGGHPVAGETVVGSAYLTIP